MTSRGILYIATGDALRNEALRSANRVSDLVDLPISIITDEEPESDVFDQVVVLEDPSYSLQDKVMNMRPLYDRTLFLDTDTYLCDPEGVHDLIDLLDGVDIAAAHDEGRKMELVYGDGPEVPKVQAPEALPMLNTGVLAFADRPQTKELLSQWRALYEQHEQKQQGINDQGAFRQAVAESAAELGIFPTEYNFRAPKPQYVFGRVRLVHGHAPNLPEIARAINENEDKRRLYRPVFRYPDPTKHQYIDFQINPGKKWAKLRQLWLVLKFDGLAVVFVLLCLGGLNRGRIHLGLLKKSLENDGVAVTIKRILGKIKQVWQHR